MSRPTDAREDRLAELKREVTARGFDRHASILEDVAALPIELQSPAVTALASRVKIQTIIYFPPQIQRGWHYVPKQALLFTPAGVIHLSASIWPSQEPGVICLAGCELMYIRVTLILLYGFLEVVAQGQDVPTRLGMEFNTIAWCFMSRPLRQLLQISHSEAIFGVPPGNTFSSFMNQALEKLPFKFANGLKIYGLLPGEALEDLVFQPGIWKRWRYFFRRPILANTLLMLTSHYMVVIQEDVDVKQGWILTYIPRSSIVEIQNQPYRLWNELVVRLKRGEQSAECRIMLKSKAVEDWRASWTRHGGRWKDLSLQQA